MLTDDEITLIVRECARGSAINRDGSTSHRIARAVIAAYEAKMREQEPVALYDGNKFYANEKSAICGCADMANLNPVFLHPAPIPEGWISANDRLPKVGRTPILVAVSWVKYGEHEDGTPTEANGFDVTEGEYVPAHGEAGGYFDSYQGSHGDIQHITHWMPLPAPPMAAARSGE